MPVRYMEDSANTATFIFPEEPPADFPRQVFLMPKGEEYDYSTWLYTMSGEVTTYEEKTGGKKKGKRPGAKKMASQHK